MGDICYQLVVSRSYDKLLGRKGLPCITSKGYNPSCPEYSFNMSGLSVVTLSKGSTVSLTGPLEKDPISVPFSLANGHQ